MLLASIDIGSNAARLLFANAAMVDGRSRVDKVELVRVPLRLGEEVFNTGMIPRHKINELITSMKAFKLLIDL
ncbi:MAG: phosphatase, partial [Bacteroidetes bacterium HGW-Bacteroidetes-22]